MTRYIVTVEFEVIAHSKENAKGRVADVLPNTLFERGIQAYDIVKSKNRD